MKKENKKWWIEWSKKYNVRKKDNLSHWLFLPKLFHKVNISNLDTEKKPIWGRLSPMEIEGIIEAIKFNKNMKRFGLIYEDKEYKIYKKDFDFVIESIIPLDCLEIIDIAIKELGQWKNAGFAHRKDYKKIIDEICMKLRKTIK